MRHAKNPNLISACPLFFTLACATLSISALAQPLPPAEYLGDIVSNFGHGERHVGAVPFNLSVDWVGQWGDSDYSMQATVEASGGLRPMAAVQAEASTGDNLQFNVRSTAIINYYVRVRPRGTPPPGNYTIPALIDARGEAQGTATAHVRINYGFPVGVETVNGHQSFTVVLPVNIDPSNPESNLVHVQLYAYARGYYLHNIYASSSQAYADPLFTFDQAAFDLEQGANTFPLADFFEFEYSEYLLNPPAPPTITIHPQDQTLCEGGAATFSADATSTAPLTYQWRLNGGALSDGGEFSGTATPTLTIDPTVWYYSGSYDCVISNVAGAVATNPAILTASAPITIDYPPQPLEVALGQPATFTVYTSGTGQMYQWRRNGVNLIDDGRITGAMTNTLSIDFAQVSDAGAYDVIVSNICNSQTSESALLTVTGSCPADFNSDNTVDFFDYLDFVDAFSAELPAADFNHDSSIDFFDYLDFVDAFSIGC